MKALTAVILLLGIWFTPAAAFDTEHGTLSELCGYQTPVIKATIYTGFHIPYDQPRPADNVVEITNLELLASLNTATGLTVPNVHEEHYIATVMTYPRIYGATEAIDIYYHGSGARPWRLHCEITGRNVRTNAPVFGCVLLGMCQ